MAISALAADYKVASLVASTLVTSAYADLGPLFLIYRSIETESLKSVTSAQRKEAAPAAVGERYGIQPRHQLSLGRVGAVRKESRVPARSTAKRRRP